LEDGFQVRFDGPAQLVEARGIRFQRVDPLAYELLRPPLRPEHDFSHQRLARVEVIVKAAGLRVGLGRNVGKARSCIPLLAKHPRRGIEYALSGGDRLAALTVTSQCRHRPPPVPNSATVFRFLSRFQAKARRAVGFAFQVIGKIDGPSVARTGQLI
jgi:hypothetical protein